MQITMRRVCCLALLAVAACHAPLRRFPLAPVLWEDRDRNDVPRPPAIYFAGLYADALNEVVLRPLTNAVAFERTGEAVNVNAVDEVPNSSWFRNRLSRYAMSPEELARGSCTGLPPDPSRGPWWVVGGKSLGVNPGMLIQVPSGQRYLLKTDADFQPERSTAADVIGSKIFYAAGYNVPCNEIVFVRPGIFRVTPTATKQDKRGRELPFTADDVQLILRSGVRLPDGRVRVSLSQFLPGRPLGPFRYDGVRADDPNDVVPHENRREVRAVRLLSAWIGHFDTREDNTLDTWVSEGGRHFVRHYELDFSDSLGSPWKSDRLSRRIGFSYYVDFSEMFVDLVTLGLYPRPWRWAPLNDEARIFDYFSAEDFEPAEWKPSYPNPAFKRVTWRDGLWMARIVARYSPAHVRAIVARGQLSDPVAEEYLVRTLLERQHRFAMHYFTRYPALDSFELVQLSDGKQTLCFDDLALRYAGVSPRHVAYQVRLLAGLGLEKLQGELRLYPAAQRSRTCVPLPLGGQRPAQLAPRDATDDHPLRYGVLEISSVQLPQGKVFPVQLHLYDLGSGRGFVLAGIERHEQPIVLGRGPGRL